MIRINLLPEEYRQPAGPPPGRMAVIFVSLVILGFAVSGWLLLVLVRTPVARERAAQLREAVGKAKQQLKAQRAREAQAAELSDQREAFTRLLEQREPFSARLDELSQALGNRQAWVERWHARAHPADGAAPGAGFRWNVRVQFVATGEGGPDEQHAVALRQALAGHGGYASPWAEIDGAALAPLTRRFAGYREGAHYGFTIEHRSAPRGVTGQGAPGDDGGSDDGQAR